MIAHNTAFVTPVVEHWLEREIAQWVHSMKDRSDDPSHHERTLLPWSYISLPGVECYHPEHYWQTYRVYEKTLHGFCCRTWWSYTMLTSHCDLTSLSRVDELKLINDCASFFACCHWQWSGFLQYYVVEGHQCPLMEVWVNLEWVVPLH